MLRAQVFIYTFVKTSVYPGREAPTSKGEGEWVDCFEDLGWKAARGAWVGKKGKKLPAEKQPMRAADRRAVPQQISLQQIHFNYKRK